MTGKVTVLGSYVMDLAGRCAHLPRPAETVIGGGFAIGPGGKGSNQAVAAHRAGADVCMVSRLGDDTFGKMALDFYRGEGMRTDWLIVDPEQETGAALIMVDAQTGQNQILVMPGACMHFTQGDIERAERVIAAGDILLLQMEINLDMNWLAVDAAHKNGVRVVLNPAPAADVPDDVLAKVDVLTPNEVEAGALVGFDVVTPGDARRAADALQHKGVGEVIITMGAQGAYVRSGSHDMMLPRHEVAAVDATGAGDAFNGALVTALAEGLDLFEAARFANVAAALSVTKPGTARSMPSRREIDAARG
jgi:ribokinase